MALSIETPFQQVSRLKLPGGLVGKVCTALIVVAPSMAAIAWAVKLPWVSTLALLLGYDALGAGHVSAGAARAVRSTRARGTVTSTSAATSRSVGVTPARSLITPYSVGASAEAPRVSV